MRNRPCGRIHPELSFEDSISVSAVDRTSSTMALLRYLLTQGIFDTTQNNSVINLDPSGIRTHTPFVRAQQGKYGLSSCVASPHGVFFFSWFGVCPFASHSYFCYSFAVHPNCATIHAFSCLLILHATTTCASRFIHCNSQRLEDPSRLPRDTRSSYHVQTKCRKVSQTWICLTEHVLEKVTGLVESGVVDTEDELRMGKVAVIVSNKSSQTVGISYASGLKIEREANNPSAWENIILAYIINGTDKKNWTLNCYSLPVLCDINNSVR